MNTKKITVTCLFSGLMLFCLSAGANSEFQQWMQQQSQGVSAQKKEFQEYKDKRDKEFTDFLKSQWKAVDIVKGEVMDEVPKPDVMPVAPPEPVVQAPVKKPVLVTVPKPVVTKKPAPAPLVVAPKGRPLTVDFFGRQIRFYYDAGLKQRLDSRIDKNAVSKLLVGFKPG